MITRNKVVALAAALVAILGLQAYALVSTRATIQDRISALESELQSVRATNAAQATQVTSDLGVITNRMGVTASELDDARKAAALLKQEQARTAARLKTEFEEQTRAVGSAVDSLREESTTKITQVQEQATTQIGAVSGDVQTVKVDLDATKTDLAASRREMGDMRDSLGREIARNSTDVAELRRRGERDYFEFDLPKTKAMQRIADIQLQLKKADTKNKRYDLSVLVDDSKMDKKSQLANEPVTFLVGRDRLRYELVVYSVEKDRVRGYISTPKDKVLSAEGPTFRP
jgi:hypothetical protein